MGEVWTPDEGALNRSKHFLDLAKEKSEAFTKAAKNQEERAAKDQQEVPEGPKMATVAAN